MKRRSSGGLGRVDKRNPDSDAGKQDENGEALDQLVVAPNLTKEDREIIRKEFYSKKKDSLD